LRTLEKREQGRANPDAQASALMLMGRKFPDTLEKPGSLENQAIEQDVFVGWIVLVRTTHSKKG
jgi:hypothetical protein